MFGKMGDSRKAFEVDKLLRQTQLVQAENWPNANSAQPPGAQGVQRAFAFDEGKLDLNLVPADWIVWMSRPFQSGLDKGYPRDNWKQSLNTEQHDAFRAKRLNSLHRHFNQYRSGEVYDSETGLHHLILAAWNGMAVAWYDLNDERKTK